MLATAAAAIFAIHSLYLERGQRNIASWFAQNLAQEEPEQDCCRGKGTAARGYQLPAELGTR